MAEEDDYDSGSEGELSSGVQLGFIDDTEEVEQNELFLNKNWSDWDGGKIGGWPSWLEPEHLPSSRELACPTCGDPTCFLLQIYCPLDTPESAYHRALYVFCCRKAQCVSRGSVKCFRCQLPRANSYYPFSTKDMASKAIEDCANVVSLCDLCGCKADFTCSKCKRVHYCSKTHQKKHWTAHKPACKADSTSDSMASSTSTSFQEIQEKERKGIEMGALFPTYGLVVSEEVLAPKLESEKSDSEDEASQRIWEGAAEPEVGAVSGEDDDVHLTQRDYNRALGNDAPDPVYDQFLSRVRRGGMAQVMRYSRWPTPEQVAAGAGPLRISSATPVDPTMPIETSSSAGYCGSCSRCGAPRQFEFQIMPQLLHHLRVDKNTSILPSSALGHPMSASSAATESGVEGSSSYDPPSTLPRALFLNDTQQDLDWGTLDVFTCSASCDIFPPEANSGISFYVEECVVVQSPLAMDPVNIEPELPENFHTKGEAEAGEAAV